MIEFIKQHYQWFFSGLGVFIIGILIKIFFFKRPNQSIKNNSRGIQAGRDINIKKDK